MNPNALPPFLRPVHPPLQMGTYGMTVSALGGAAPGATNGSIGSRYVRQQQQETQWCWAAVSASVADFYGNASGWTQCSIATAELSLPCCFQPLPAGANVPWWLEKALTRVARLASWRRSTVAFVDIQQEIQASRPLCCRILWVNSGGAAHFVTISGWSVDASGVEWLDIEDPDSGSVNTPRKKFETAYSSQGDQWTHSYFTN